MEKFVVVLQNKLEELMRLTKANTAQIEQYKSTAARLEQLSRSNEACVASLSDTMDDLTTRPVCVPNSSAVTVSEELSREVAELTERLYEHHTQMKAMDENVIKALNELAERPTARQIDTLVDQIAVEFAAKLQMDEETLAAAVRELRTQIGERATKQDVVRIASQK
jgi:hypothetical protein